MMSTPTVSGRPGVTVTEVITSRETGSTSGAISRAVLLADLTRGPAEPTTVRSWTEFRAIYGDWSDNPPVSADHRRNASVDAAFLYFSNTPSGGSALTVLRMVRDDAVRATGSLLNQADSPAITFTAQTPGDWGSHLRVSVVGTWSSATDFAKHDFSSEFDTDTGSKTDKLSAHVISQHDLDQYGGGNLAVVVESRDRRGAYTELERFTGLSLDMGSRRYLEDVVNGSSRYVTAQVDTTDSLHMDNTSVVLSGGANGTGPLALTSSLGMLDQYPEPLTMTWSGHWTASDLLEVANYCTSRGDAFLIIDTQDVGGSAADVVDHVNNLGIKTPFAAAYYPAVIINDPASGPNNVQRSAPCGGAVLGAFAANDQLQGIWRTPAGTTTSLSGVVGPKYRFSNADLDTLNRSTHPVNPLRVVVGAGTCIMGGRTLLQTGADRYVGVRRSFSYVKSRLSALSEFALFETNGPDLWERITVRLENFLGIYYQGGAFRGARERDAFYVRCDASNNTPATIAAGEVHIEVGVAVEYPAEFVVIRLTHNQSTIRVV